MTTQPLCYEEQGTFVITWTFDDGNGNVSTATQNVIIDNTTPPVIPILADVTGECSACAVAPVFTNICTGATITATTNDPLCYTEQGSYVITWTFDDGNGNVSTATQNVIVDDVTAPVVPTLADVTGECSACAVAPTTTDNCGGTITATTTDALCYTTQGTHVITWTFDDGNGNISTATQNVIVDDISAPVIPTLADATGECSVTVQPPVAIDGCNNTQITGTTPDPLQYTEQGTYVITWTFNDGNGNIGTATQNVIVDDVTPPTAPTLVNVTGECSATATPPITMDNCAGEITASTSDPLTYGSEGTYIIHWTFNDGNGNSIVVNQTVIVDDITAPVTPVLADVSGQCSVTVPTPSTTDNCNQNLIFGTTSDDTQYDEIGDYVVTWTFNDGNGNTTTATQQVHVTAVGALQVASQDADCNEDEDATFNLNSYLVGLDVPANGTWADTNNTGGLSGNDNSIFTPLGVPVGNYIFTYTVQDGDCTRTVELTMTVDDECEVGNPDPVCIPVVRNAMSPNNDGQNDWFIIENFGGECITANTVEIYNRWGILVFETNNYDNNTRVFKGYSEGRTTVGNDELPTGTYFYILNWTANGVEQHKEGYLYLSR
jgi:gliding motility-associated-like protein